MLLPVRRAPLICLVLMLGVPFAHAASTNAPSVWEEFSWPLSATGTPVLVECLAHIRNGESSVALSKLEGRLQDFPQDAGALHISGLLFWDSGNREESTRRLVRAARSPEAQRITFWALAALSQEAHSPAESVGWIKRAARTADRAELEAWLNKPQFQPLCNFPPYRQLLASLELEALCPTAKLDLLGLEAREQKEAVRSIAEQAGPTPTLRLPVQEGIGPLKLRLDADEESRAPQPRYP